MRFSREEAEARRVELLKPGQSWKPALWTFDHEDGRRLLVKDNSETSRVFRFLIGRIALKREFRAYHRLADLPWTPACAGWIDRDSLVMEYLDAIPLNKLRPEQVPPSFYGELVQCVAQMHERCIVHMDLRHRSNILVTPDGKPKLIDFEAGARFPLGRFWRRLFVPLLAWIDRSALIKHGLRYFPDQVSDADRRWFERLGKLRRFWPGRLWPPGGKKGRRQAKADSA